MEWFQLELVNLPGVVDTGLFTGVVDEVIYIIGVKRRRTMAFQAFFAYPDGNVKSVVRGDKKSA